MSYSGMSKLFGNYIVLCIFEWGSVHYNQMPNPSETNHSKRILATGGAGLPKIPLEFYHVVSP